MSEITTKTIFKTCLYIIGLALFLAYFTWSYDLIPSKLGLIGYVDDAIVAIFLFLLIRKITHLTGLDLERKTRRKKK